MKMGWDGIEGAWFKWMDEWMDGIERSKDR